MASYVPPKKNTAFIIYVALKSQADGNLFQVNPTIAAGDFKVSTDGGASANLTTLPTVTPAGGRTVKITLSAAEMNGDNIAVVGSDAVGAEWADILIGLQTSTNQIDELALQTALTSAVADSVPADGSRPSVQQGILMLTRFLMEAAVAGTTVTVKKEDGITSSMTFTINDATSPTSITRAT